MICFALARHLEDLRSLTATTDRLAACSSALHVFLSSQWLLDMLMHASRLMPDQQQWLPRRSPATVSKRNQGQTTSDTIPFDSDALELCPSFYSHCLNMVLPNKFPVACGVSCAVHACPAPQDCFARFPRHLAVEQSRPFPEKKTQLPGRETSKTTSTKSDFDIFGFKEASVP